ncbi:nickel ABC transporter permease subunit NikC [Oceanidesulfovibrio indonesiensis]|uniref:Nickel ABC transporter permease subunit NikC n=1 Tax=Oceanidesulfovibrio indonesiensis TaxID=54767 RepID=A0A7M3MCA9_9BACT|nr:nickel ABC transporter permease subunit NikC [Oceanidesulfovibrio indonesiensis]TVM15986.1 nickel ABC transporter permease subunit NikC [Oceanidesulfovibrio indonesiensis]
MIPAGMKRYVRRGLVGFALALVVLLVSSAAFAPVLSPYDPTEVNLVNKFAEPGPEHILGCDHLGRDVATRLLYGARTSLGSVVIIAGIILLLGFAVGATAGYMGGAVDSTLMRICDVFLTFPTFILAMFMIGVLGTGIVNVILAVSLTHWAWYARIIRSFVLSLKNREYVLAARVAGTGRFMTVARHVLPPVFAQLAILATLDIGHMMMHVSGLSFLGLGVTPPTAEWGVMIADARQFVWTHPELIMYPGLAIFLTVMAFNILGDALRDALDPHAADYHVTDHAVSDPAPAHDRLAEAH